MVSRVLRSARLLAQALLAAAGALVAVGSLLVGDELGASNTSSAGAAAESTSSQPERADGVNGAEQAEQAERARGGAIDRSARGEDLGASMEALMPSDPEVSVVAHATVGVVAIHETPEHSAPTRALRHPDENGSPLVFLVERRRPDGWLQVQLPVRPNGSTGWIREDDVLLRQHRYRIVVELGARELRLFRDGELELRSPVGVGAQDTPTPGGTFYVKELLRPPRPDTVYGPYAFGLSGFSNSLDEFAGGEGVIGIHGTDDPDAIGNEVSHGCIRLPNDRVEELVGVLPLGTPVTIER